MNLKECEDFQLRKCLRLEPKLSLLHAICIGVLESQLHAIENREDPGPLSFSGRHCLDRTA